MGPTSKERGQYPEVLFGPADYQHFLDDLGEKWFDQPLDKVTAVVPDTETSSAVGWVAGSDPVFMGSGTTLGTWLQTISLSSNSSLNFGGRFVYEAPPADDTTYDTCYWNNSSSDYSIFDSFSEITGQAWWVDGGNQWGYDAVGYFSNAVVYYRAHSRTPCGYSYGQDMYIDSAMLGPQNYQTNELLYTIDDTAGYICSKRKEPKSATSTQSSCKSY